VRLGASRYSTLEASGHAEVPLMTLEVEHEWGLNLWSEESGISMLSDKVYGVCVFGVELAEASVCMSQTG